MTMIHLKDSNPRQFKLIIVLLMVLILILFIVGNSNFGSNVRMINDWRDRDTYVYRGSWILKGEIPYRDALNEYPQIPVALFGLATWASAVIRPPELSLEFVFYNLWALFMMAVFILTVWQVYKLLPDGKKALVWFMFLPSIVYFSIHRFDILPVFLSMLMFLFIRQKRFGWASFFLSLGVMTKWYLALILPIMLLYEINQTRRFPWLSLSVFVGVITMIIIPTYMFGGLQSVWQPYGLHLSRGMEPGTLIWISMRIIQHFRGGIDPVLPIRIFTIFQFSGVLILLFTRMNSFKKVVLASTVCILIFILFSRGFG
jgi:hypothetical protein